MKNPRQTSSVQIIIIFSRVAAAQCMLWPPHSGGF